MEFRPQTFFCLVSLNVVAFLTALTGIWLSITAFPAFFSGLIGGNRRIAVLDR